MLGRSVLAALVATSSFCGKVDEDLPNAVGTFSVESTLVSNSCGQGGYPVPAVTELEATIRGYAGQNATFRWSNQGGSSSGFATTGGVYSFESRTTSTEIEPEPSILYPGCQLAENVAMTFTVTPTPVAPADAGVDQTAYTLDGQVVIDVSPVSGSDCTPLLGAYGGPWVAVPCQVRIDLAGVRTDD